jgi:thiol-disulfide isomerase/thioredoxin
MRAGALSACLLLAAPACGPPAPPSHIQRLDPPAAPGAVTPHLAAAAGTLLLSWFEPEGEAGQGTLRFASLEDSGTGWRWQPARRVATGSTFFVNWADFPSISRGADRSLLAHWLEKSGGEGLSYGVRLARSRDDGAIWRSVRLAREGGPAGEQGFVSVVAEDDGFRAFWLEGPGHEGDEPTTLRTGHIGDKEEDTEVIDPRVCDCCQTAAGWSADGPFVVYRDRSDTEIRDLSIVRRIQGRWTAPAPVFADGWVVPGCPVNGPSVAVDPEGRRVAVAWFTAAANHPRVLLAFSDDAGASFDPPVIVDDQGPLGRASVILDARGDAVVAWLGSGSGETAPLIVAHVARRPGAPTGTMGPKRVVTRGPATRAAGFPRIGRLSDDIVVVWTEPGTDGGIRGAVIPAGFLSGGPQDRKTAEAPPSPRVWDGRPGSMAPAYEAAGLDGAPFLLAAHRGHPLLLNVWATWCGPCRDEQPVLQSLHDRFAAAGVRLVGLSVDDAADRPRVARHVEHEAIPWPIAIDTSGQAASIFRIPAIPATFLFDADGTLVWRRDGMLPPGDPELEAALARVVDRSRKPAR